MISAQLSWRNSHRGLFIPFQYLLPFRLGLPALLERYTGTYFDDTRISKVEIKFWMATWFVRFRNPLPLPLNGNTITYFPATKLWLCDVGDDALRVRGRCLLPAPWFQQVEASLSPTTYSVVYDYVNKLIKAQKHVKQENFQLANMPLVILSSYVLSRGED